MKVYFSNAFSLQMVEPNCRLAITNIPLNDIGALLETFHKNGEIIPAIGHADTAELVAGLLRDKCEAEVVAIATKVNRVSIKLTPGCLVAEDVWEVGDLLIVAQYIGPRLPEGCKVLLEGARVEFRMVAYDYWAD
jgi:hypothetical protein